MNNIRMIADLHAPYIWGGTDVKKGLDCSGYMDAAAKWTGLPVQRTTAAYMADGLCGWAGTLLPDKLRDAQPGDLLFYDWGSGKVKHVGAAARDPQTGDPSLYHASSSRNKVLRVPLVGVLAKPSRVRDIFRDPVPK